MGSRQCFRCSRSRSKERSPCPTSSLLRSGRCLQGLDGGDWGHRERRIVASGRRESRLPPGMAPSVSLARCGECDGTCRPCWGALDEDSPVQQALAWATMVASTGSDPSWRLAQIDQVLRDSPASDGGPEWDSVSRSLRSLQAIITFGAQGRNAATAIRDGMRSWRLADMSNSQVAAEGKNPAPTTGEGNNPVPVDPPHDRPGWKRPVLLQGG